MTTSRTIIRSGTDYYVDRGRSLRSAEARRLWGLMLGAVGRRVAGVLRRRTAGRSASGAVGRAA